MSAPLQRSFAICLCLLGVACDDDEAIHVSTIGMVDATLPPFGESPADAGGSDATGSGGAASDSGFEDATRELSAIDCPAFEMPGEPNPLDTLVAIGVTETRIYAASSTRLFAFDRQNDCAGARLTSFVVEPFTELVGLTGVDGDSLVVSSSSGLVRIDASGTPGAVCTTSTAQSLAYSFERHLGLAAFGAGVERWELTATGCSLSHFALSQSPFSVASIEIDENGSALVALLDKPGERPELRLEDGTGAGTLIDERGQACSARAVVATALGSAVLDSTCGRVRIIASSTERFGYAIPAGEFGRALARPPGASPSKVVLGTVSSPGAPPKLRVIDIALP